MKSLRYRAFPLAAILSLSLGTWSTVLGWQATDTQFGDELPRIAPHDPADSISQIAIKPGYQLELAAAEPLVRDPVAMSFDEDGRMYVVEMCDYSEQDKDFLGTIRRLEDRDQDGKFEVSTLFAEKLSWPTGVLCYDGGIFVAAAPDIWYFKDENGDGKADIQRKVYTGFGRSNVQGLLNSFCWGIDNRIYCQISSSGASITRPDKPEVAPVVANGRDFSFDPKTLEFRLESGGGQHGMSFDDWGRRYVCHNGDHLMLHVYADRYAKPGAPFPLPPSRQSIAADGPQANVYRISPVEPWRIVRTRLRVTNQVPGAIEGGGRASGYFTSATGITIYRGDTYPQDMQGVAIVGDVGSNIIHRKTLREDGISMLGTRIDQDSEFIAAKDIWFRPVQFANSPDGNLYIADLYREVIEHPKSLPEGIKKHLDLTSGRDRGRIYRVVADGHVRKKMPALSQASFDELLRALESKNGWERDTASRLIYQKLAQEHSKSDHQVYMSRLANTVAHSQSPQARLHAVGLLSRFSETKVEIVPALQDAHPRVREWAILSLEDRFHADPAIQSKLIPLTADADLRVRFQLALSLGASSLEGTTKSKLAYRILQTSSEDAYVSAACFNAMGAESVVLLGDELQSKQNESTLANLAPLAQVAGKLATPEQLAELDRALPDVSPSAALKNLYVNLIDALQNRFATAESSSQLFEKLPKLRATRDELIASSRTQCLDRSLSAGDRINSIRYMMWSANDSDIALLAKLLHQSEPQEIQNAASNALRKFSSAEVPNQMLRLWPSLTPKLRTMASDVLFSRPAWIELLVSNAEAGKFNLLDLDIVRLNSLRNGAKTKQRVEKLVKSSNFGSRAEVFEQYRSALSLSGNPENGKQVFARACAACHRVEGVGYELAPNLASFQFRGAEAILQNIIEPNREVNPQYVSYTIVTNDDRVVTGMILNESAASVTLSRGENQSDTIERGDIEEMKSSRLSLMPEGLEKQIDVQSMADLLAYLLQAK